MKGMRTSDEEGLEEATTRPLVGRFLRQGLPLAEQHAPLHMPCHSTHPMAHTAAAPAVHGSQEALQSGCCCPRMMPEPRFQQQQTYHPRSPSLQPPQLRSRHDATARCPHAPEAPEGLCRHRGAQPASACHLPNKGSPASSASTARYVQCQVSSVIHSFS